MRPIRTDDSGIMNPSTLDLSKSATSVHGQVLRWMEEGRLELPLLPDTAARVVAVCNDDSCDASELAQLLQQDVSLAGHVLRIANSAAYAPTQPIVSLSQAVSRLGFRAICGIAIGVAVQGKVFRVKGYEQPLASLWKHSATAAAWCKEIARQRRRNVEGAFLSGLLHDVGRPVVLQAVVDILQDEEGELTNDEIVLLMDVLHEDVGGRILGEWDMPGWVVGSVAFHHHWEDAEEFQEEAATTHLGDRLAHWSVHEAGTEFDLSSVQPQLTFLGLYADELAPLFEKGEAVRQAAEALS